VKIYLCPADPSIPRANGVYGQSTINAGSNAGGQGDASTSYDPNMYVFDPKAPKPINQAMQDGTSVTVLFVEHYADCVQPFNWAMQARDPGPWECVIGYGFPDYTGQQANTMSSFAPSQPVFQLNPSPANCKPTTASTGHPSGMVIALGDGSVRTVTPTISVSTWYKACTPADGGYLGTDW
jgi:hypothetical protein